MTAPGYTKPSTIAVKPKADADALSIVAFIAAFFLPLLALIMGHVSISQAHRHGYRASSLAVWATVLGWVFTALAVLLVILFITAFAVGVSHSGTSPGGY